MLVERLCNVDSRIPATQSYFVLRIPVCCVVRHARQSLASTLLLEKKIKHASRSLLKRITKGIEFQEALEVISDEL